MEGSERHLDPYYSPHDDYHPHYIFGMYALYHLCLLKDKIRNLEIAMLYFNEFYKYTLKIPWEELDSDAYEISITLQLIDQSLRFNRDIMAEKPPAEWSERLGRINEYSQRYTRIYIGFKFLFLLEIQRCMLGLLPHPLPSHASCMRKGNFWFRFAPLSYIREFIKSGRLNERENGIKKYRNILNTLLLRQAYEEIFLYFLKYREECRKKIRHVIEYVTEERNFPLLERFLRIFAYEVLNSGFNPIPVNALINKPHLIPRVHYLYQKVFSMPSPTFYRNLILWALIDPDLSSFRTPCFFRELLLTDIVTGDRRKYDTRFAETKILAFDPLFRSAVFRSHPELLTSGRKIIYPGRIRYNPNHDQIFQRKVKRMGEDIETDDLIRLQTLFQELEG